MNSSYQFGALGESRFQVLWADGDHALCRAWYLEADGTQTAMLAVRPTEHPTPASLDRLAHEYGLRDGLDSAWAARPLELVREGDRTLLLLEDAGGEPLEGLLGAAMELGRGLRIAIGIASALGKAHQRGLVHKDVKPANILVSLANVEVRLTGFGIASRLPRERQAPEPPETIAGTLAYMAPEQTGRMNRSVDARSDLYALGVTLYQMLTGVLPFAATDPLEWVHCHIARKPVPPHDRLATIPATVSAIVMKLLAKTAEERYQTAGGVEHDLRCCLSQLETQGQIDPFPLGECDIPDRLLIPEKLYGREREIATLLTAFERVVKSGAPELVLVSGYSGIGKSSVVHELHKVLVPPRGLFAAGKFDQYKRDIPYSTLAEAFQSLVRLLLGKSDTELSGWREALLDALGPNGRLMVDLVPELRLVIGDQPPAAELPPQDAQRRFQLVLRRFIGVFARSEHPLALFLDDLQWLDAATLDLIEDLLTRSDLQHVILIGAYRDNEVTPAHPLMRNLDAIKTAGGKVTEITLAPLAGQHLGQLIADALRCETHRAAPLAQLVHDKTGGNPFFAIQFMSSLAEEGMLTFDHDAARWSWDLDRIHAKGYTDNVVDLMVGKLTRLPAETQHALQQLACVGSSAEITTLSIVLATSEEEIHAVLWMSVRQELVERLEGSYKFVHDRVQEAAYGLVPEGDRAAAHLRIGRVLASSDAPEEIEERVFEIANHLNRGADLIVNQVERDRLAELNLRAGKRAKSSTAYQSALAYLRVGRALLSEDCWDTQYPLAFDFELHLAECEFLAGDAAAEERLSKLSERARSLVDVAAVASLRQVLYTMLNRLDRSVEVALDYLRKVGVDWTAQPSKEEVVREYEEMFARLESRSIEEMAELPRMSDPKCCATVEVLTELVPAAYFTDIDLCALVVCRIANLSFEHGNSNGSVYAYSLLGFLLRTRFGNHAAGFRFGTLALKLSEERGLDRFRARVCLNFAYCVNPWTRHIQTGRPLLRRGLTAANETGDLTFAAYLYYCLITDLLASGDPLDQAQREAESGLEFASRTKFGLVVDILTGHLRLIRALRGLTVELGSFSDAAFDEHRFEEHLERDARLANPTCVYWIRKLQARYFAGDYDAAVAAAAKAEPLLWTSPASFEMADYHFYAGLTRAAHHDVAPVGERASDLQALAASHSQIAVWAKNCPDNFENRDQLLAAEIARIDGRELDAERLYEQAIRSARVNGFVHNEALAHELAARFYASRDLETSARAHLKEARQGYIRWGADGKVRQFDELYPHLREPEAAPAPTGTIGTPVEHLDLATVIKVSQAISGEIVLEKLLDTLMHTAIEHAGAERGLLIFCRGGEPRIAAEATISSDTVVVQLRDEPVTVAALPESVLQYVVRTNESVILEDAVAQNLFSEDPYIRQHQARSILCLPLLNQGHLTGVLYLENNLAPRVFVPSRIAVLKLLASQAAISLQISCLYGDLQEREAKIRRLVDANIVGIFIWDLEGHILEANDAFLRIVGYDREDLASGRLHWTELTPPEWLDRDRERWVPEIKVTGILQPFEKEYFRKDGGRVPVLIGAASFDESGRQGVAFVLDLTERNRAEAEVRKSEQRYREVQMALAHANRVTTMGQLAASISHEIKQPIAANAANAQAGLCWLSARPPNLEEARQAFDRIVQDAKRASEITNRIRGLVKNVPPCKERLQINEAIGEVIALTRGEAEKHSVSVRMHLAEDLPLVEGDRVQVQQVMLNLIVNAIEATSTVDQGQRELTVSTSKDKSGSALIAVRDSGPGVAPQNVERLFEPFYTTKAAGMGMGLSICRSIVEAHGGRIWVSGNAPHGAAFQFTVPFQPSNA